MLMAHVLGHSSLSFSKGNFKMLRMFEVNIYNKIGSDAELCLRIKPFLKFQIH